MKDQFEIFTGRPLRSLGRQSPGAHPSGTNTDTRASGPTSRVACPCPVKSSAIKMSPGPSRRTVPSPISMSTAPERVNTP